MREDKVCWWYWKLQHSILLWSFRGSWELGFPSKITWRTRVPHEVAFQSHYKASLENWELGFPWKIYGGQGFHVRSQFLFNSCIEVDSDSGKSSQEDNYCERLMLYLQWKWRNSKTSFASLIGCNWTMGTCFLYGARWVMPKTVINLLVCWQGNAIWVLRVKSGKLLHSLGVSFFDNWIVGGGWIWTLDVSIENIKRCQPVKLKALGFLGVSLVYFMH